MRDIKRILSIVNAASSIPRDSYEQIQLLYTSEQYGQCADAAFAAIERSSIGFDASCAVPVSRAVMIACWALYRSGLYGDAQVALDAATTSNLVEYNSPDSDILRAWLLLKKGQHQAALALIRQAMKEQRALGNTEYMSHMLIVRGMAAYRSGKSQRAIEDLRSAVSIAKALGDYEYECMALNSLGLVYMTNGSYTEAHTALQAALGVTKQIRQDRKQIHILINMSIVAFKIGVYEDTQRYCFDALDMLSRQDDQSPRSAAKLMLARVSYQTKDCVVAAKMAHDLLEALDHESESRYEPLILELLGDIAVAESNRSSAERYYTRALELGRAQAPEGDIVAECMRRLASMRLRFDEAFESIPLLKEAIEACEKCGERYEVGIAYRDLSIAYRTLDQFQQSLQHSKTSVDMFREMGAKLELAKSLLEAARSRHAWYAIRARDMELGLHADDPNPYTHLEEAWSYTIEAFHAYADLGFEDGQDECESLMAKLREEGTPIWMRKTPGERGKATAERTVDDKPFIAGAPSMRKMLTMSEIAASTDEPVLVTGETGTGKELVAKMIHEAGARSDAPFVPVNCAAIPETLFEREFFGHTKGAYTGAEGAKPGLCEEAHTGTLFLDEIGDMPTHLQVKLLRLLQEGTYRRLGDPEERRVDLRIIAATNAPLAELITEGRFRQDLYYRLQTLEMIIPPLRERAEDLEDLMALFISRALKEEIPPKKLFDRSVMTAFRRYPWPGNVRELEAMTRRMALLARHNGKATAEMLPEQLAQWREGRKAEKGSLSLTSHIQRAERSRIGHALVLNAGNRSEAARVLGITRSQLYRRMEKLGIRVPK